MEIDSSSSTITLQPFKLSDVDDFMIWASDDRVTRYVTWKPFTSKEEALTHIKDVCIQHPWYRSICIHDRSIGFVWIYPGSGDERCRADIGYAVALEFWGQGVATKAVKIAISEALKNFPEVVRLQAYVVVENKASQRVLEKVGFLQEGDE
ncbi:hypothetical protein LWI28_008212 [Acer negundo]|uniref:N-acetyltransferase domain-containing protein n=1 Tax=Acer negundo TaxID=4023 RepID=A0AAD5NWS0_ACENE|nr:hypothetical protein LWI28_008212 [Acer negundo]